MIELTKRRFAIRALATASFVLVLGGSGLEAAEKLKYGTPLRLHPAHYLLILAGQEKGFFKDYGLEVEWVPFRGTAEQWRAFAAGSVIVGTGTAVGAVQALGRGLPGVVVAHYQNKDAWYIYVASASALKEPKDLKGKKIGISAIGGTDYGYTMLALKALGLDKDIRLVGVGGIPESIAALKAGAIDATMRSVYTFVPLIEKGEAREVLNINQFLPKEWVVHTLFVHKDLVKDKAETVRRLARAVVTASLFLKENPGWAMQKVKEVQGVAEAGAKLVMENLEFTDGRIEKKGLENVRNFLIEFGLIEKEKAPLLEKMYTAEFTG